MSAEKLMVLSNIDVFREITQNKYIYFNPHDGNDIAQNIENSLDLHDNKKRDMISYGNQRIKNFQFNETAKTMSEIYKKYI